MARMVTFIEATGSRIVRVGRIRGRAPAAPGRHVITAPAQLRRLERHQLDHLKFVGGRVQRKTAGELAADVAAGLAANDARWFRRDRQRALVDAIAAQIPGVTVADIEDAYNANLATSRSSQ